MKLRAGDWVEVRSRDEILKTLDKNARLEELPFMPQMFQYCGQRFQVFKRAHKTCDTVNNTGGRRLRDGIHLDLRCDGNAYGGCQAGCLVFWKEAWLRPVDLKVTSSKLPCDSTRQNGFLCSEEDVRRGTRVQNQQADDEITYICQATQLPNFTTPLPWWDIRQYLEDYASRNATLGRILSGLIYVTYYHLAQAWRNRLGGRPSRWLYDRYQALWGGVPFPRRTGIIPVGQPTPTSTLNLQPQELVRIRPYQEILATLDVAGKNRGLPFDAELVPYCGGTYSVKTRVDRFISEKTGKMSSLKTPAVILEGVWCKSRYSNCKMFCPRSIYSWWREIWLERIGPEVKVKVEGDPDGLRDSMR